VSAVDTTGWPALARLTLRTSRRRLVAWPVITGFLVWVSASQIPQLYDTPEARAAYESTAGESAATKIFNGRGYGLDTVGGITAYELGFYTLVFFPVVALHLAIHLTRTQEASGRFDLLAAARLGRTAPLVSAMVVLTGVMGLTALLSLLGLLASGLGGGSWWYAGALLLQLLAVAAMGLVVAQVATDGQQAHGLGLAVLAVLFLVRAVVDGAGAGLTWLSPLSWFAEVRPFGSPQVWPLIAYAVLALLLLGAAAALNVRRDLGSGLLETRPGPPTAGPQLGTPVGLATRLLRGVWLGWAVATTVWAFLLGVIAREMRELFEGNPDMQAMLGVGVDPEDLMISTGGFFIALLALGFVVQAVVRLAGEETEGRLGVVLATKVSRTEWWLGAGLTALAGGVAIQLLAALALGVGIWVGTGEASGLATGIQVGLAFVSALLLSGAVCLLLSAVSARLAAAGWVLFGGVMTLDLLGAALDLPEWTLDLSPLHLIGRPPVDPVSTLGVLLIGLLAVAVVGASLLLFRRRDLAR
jgi:ABC-2 type transport system permease protein